MPQDNFAHAVQELEERTTILAKKKTRESILESLPHYTIQDVPKLHWCGHYLDSNKEVIPDGADCCFWHWIGLPKRWGVRHPAYPWQEKLFHEYYDLGLLYYYIGKVPKIGASRTWIGIAIHEALTNPTWVNGQVGIVVGTGGNEAEKMIERCKELIAYKDEKGIPLRDEKGNLLTKFPINEDYNTKKEFSINSVEFRSYPANNVDSIRSKENMRLEIVDEIGFFTMVEQQTVRDAFEHYIGNSDVRIALITTAGKAPSGVAYNIETEDPSLYSHHLLNYQLGLEPHPESGTTLFDPTELKKLENSSSWIRNYLRVWGHGAGNIYNSEIIDEISKYPYDMPADISKFNNVLSLDPAFGKVRTKTSSKFAGLGMWEENGHYYIRSWFELEECPMDEAIERIKQEITAYGYKNLIIDGHHTGIINTFRKQPGIHTYGVNYNESGIPMIDMSAETVHAKLFHFFNNQEMKNQLKAIRRNDKGMPDKTLSRFDLGDTLSQAIWHFRGKKDMHMRKLKGKF